MGRRNNTISDRELRSPPATEGHRTAALVGGPNPLRHREASRARRSTPALGARRVGIKSAAEVVHPRTRTPREAPHPSSPRRSGPAPTVEPTQVASAPTTTTRTWGVLTSNPFAPLADEPEEVATPACNTETETGKGPEHGRELSVKEEEPGEREAPDGKGDRGHWKTTYSRGHCNGGSAKGCLGLTWVDSD
jgi:hypothetical protein